jgi:hypothetical protein
MSLSFSPPLSLTTKTPLNTKPINNCNKAKTLFTLTNFFSDLHLPLLLLHYLLHLLLKRSIGNKVNSLE